MPFGTHTGQLAVRVRLTRDSPSTPSASQTPFLTLSKIAYTKFSAGPFLSIHSGKAAVMSCSGGLRQLLRKRSNSNVFTAFTPHQNQYKCIQYIFIDLKENLFEPTLFRPNFRNISAYAQYFSDLQNQPDFRTHALLRCWQPTYTHCGVPIIV